MSVLKIDTHQHVTTLTLNRPDRMNALNYELYMALEDAVRGCTSRVIIITGAGERAFCTGDDVKEILSQGNANSPAEMVQRGRRTGGLTPAADALLYTDIPVIAAINGYALGWGMEIAIMADIRIASQKASFGELFVQRGVCCDAAGLGRLAHLVGRERASELLFTGDMVSAEDALAMGLVSRLAAPGDLMPTAMALAERIAANPPKAVRSIKAGLRRALDPDWRDVGEWAMKEIRSLMTTSDAKESAAAFLEKRDPVFTGT
ncbi:MAG: enoyl-CoA hydratase/isomerase family protein [Pseudomonadota bacterium]